MTRDHNKPIGNLRHVTIVRRKCANCKLEAPPSEVTPIDGPTLYFCKFCGHRMDIPVEVHNIRFTTQWVRTGGTRRYAAKQLGPIQATIAHNDQGDPRPSDQSTAAAAGPTAADDGEPRHDDDDAATNNHNWG